MAEYIEREAVRSAVKSKTMTKYDWSEEIDFEDFEKVLDAIPTAEVAPVVHGRWVLIEIGYGAKIYECSECKDDDYWKHHFAGGFEHYCPNCGARMDGE